MELRQHEIDFADEVAERVAEHLKQLEIPAQAEALGLRAVPAAVVAMSPAEAEGEDEHVCLDADDCHYVRAAAEGVTALEQELVTAATREQELTQALTETAEALVKAASLAGAATALVAAHEAAFDMFNRLTPSTDGQMALYPLSLRHLQSFRVLQARVDDLVQELSE